MRNGHSPLVSVLIPAYNPRFFEEALVSAVEQDYRNLEIIVCDDSEGEAIGNVCRRIAYGRIVYVKNRKNLGFSGNFTQCFNLAKGEYVKFLNDDDILLQPCISRMVQEFETHGPELALVTSRRHVINEQSIIGDDLVDTHPIAFVTSYMQGLELGNFTLVNSTNVIGEPTTVMFRKRDVDLHGHLFMLNGNEYTCLADLSLWLRLLSKGGAVYIAEPLSLFRVHPGQEQKKSHVALKCLTERFFLVADARSLGFLQPPNLYGLAMRAVADRFHAALTHPQIDVESRRRLEELWARIPADYLPPRAA